VSRKKHIQEGKRRASASPWLWDFRWGQIGFTVQKWKKPAKYLLMFIVFGGFLAPFNWWAFFSGEKSFLLWFVVGLFDVITVGIGVAFFYQLFQYFKYGNSRLLFYGFPFFLGESLKVGLEGLPPRDQIEELELNLRFIEERYEVSGSGDNRNSSVVCYQYYLEARKLQPAEIFPGPVLDMEWQLPENPEYACRMSERPVKFWELEVKAKSPGIDYYEKFLLPVYSRS
jgi:hypothetical protein